MAASTALELGPAKWPGSLGASSPESSTRQSRRAAGFSLQRFMGSRRHAQSSGGQFAELAALKVTPRVRSANLPGHAEGRARPAAPRRSIMGRSSEPRARLLPSPAAAPSRPGPPHHYGDPVPIALKLLPSQILDPSLCGSGPLGARRLPLRVLPFPKAESLGSPRIPRVGSAVVFRPSRICFHLRVRLSVHVSSRTPTQLSHEQVHLANSRLVPTWLARESFLKYIERHQVSATGYVAVN